MDIIFILWRVSFFLEKYPNIYFLIEIYGDDLCMCYWHGSIMGLIESLTLSNSFSLTNYKKGRADVLIIN